MPLPSTLEVVKYSSRPPPLLPSSQWTLFSHYCKKQCYSRSPVIFIFPERTPVAAPTLLSALFHQGFSNAPYPPLFACLLATPFHSLSPGIKKRTSGLWLRHLPFSSLFSFMTSNPSINDGSKICISRADFSPELHTDTFRCLLHQTDVSTWQNTLCDCTPTRLSAPGKW